jgi:putative transposase
MVDSLRQEHGLSERQACAAVGLRRSVYRYQPQPSRDEQLIELLLELAHQKPEFGSKKLFELLRRRGHQWNHKRVHRLSCHLKLNKRRRGKRRLPMRNPAPLAVSQRANECWSADFMSDQLWEGHRFRTFNVVDDFNREALAIEVDSNLPAERVVRVLERIAVWLGYTEETEVG